jgi:hypothetical protein
MSGRGWFFSLILGVLFWGLLVWAVVTVVKAAA